ncbi:TPA: hypothetical protein N0F65_001584 [Lagenidium giganteum]|uniref:Uncharacterized protein n=1 Tax=Lagenidium giganteum TaxID=4803 RepID=A0AAV2Z6H2_9STRA|nr:TPA: hypothetical protein N0F65_001584 [Lagenidium giganteum]
MSLGFLTESALLPSKAKPIKVDSKSVLDLKAIVFRKEQEREVRNQKLQRAVDDDECDDGGRLGKYARLRGSKRRKTCKDDDRENAGVEKRRQKDLAERELSVENDDDDAALQKKSREMLRRKAQLYEDMLHGRVQSQSAQVSECLVDFTQKDLPERSESVNRSGIVRENADHSSIVDIVDEFGRTRRVQRGSVEHKEFQRAQAKDDAPASHEEDDTDRSHGPSSGFVVSQWEKRLKSDEKQYLQQVHEGVELVKAAMPDKLTRKQLRFQRLKQQSALANNSTAAPANEDSSADTTAAAQATAFLEGLSSLT